MAKGPQKRDVRITVRLPEDLADLVQAAADADRRSKSDWIVLQLEAIFAKKTPQDREVGSSVADLVAPHRAEAKRGRVKSR